MFSTLPFCGRSADGPDIVLFSVLTASLETARLKGDTGSLALRILLSGVEGDVSPVRRYVTP